LALAGAVEAGGPATGVAVRVAALRAGVRPCISCRGLLFWIGDRHSPGVPRGVALTGVAAGVGVRDGPGDRWRDRGTMRAPPFWRRIETEHLLLATQALGPSSMASSPAEEATAVLTTSAGKRFFSTGRRGRIARARV